MLVGLRVQPWCQRPRQGTLRHPAADGDRQLVFPGKPACKLRNRPACEERFGTDAYQAMLTDSLWAVYQMIGKLNLRIYVLPR